MDSMAWESWKQFGGWLFQADKCLLISYNDIHFSGPNNCSIAQAIPILYDLSKIVPLETFPKLDLCALSNLEWCFPVQRTSTTLALVRKGSLWRPWIEDIRPSSSFIIGSFVQPLWIRSAFLPNLCLWALSVEKEEHVGGRRKFASFFAASI